MYTRVGGGGWVGWLDGGGCFVVVFSFGLNSFIEHTTESLTGKIVTGQRNKLKLIFQLHDARMARCLKRSVLFLLFLLFSLLVIFLLPDITVRTKLLTFPPPPPPPLPSSSSFFLFFFLLSLGVWWGAWGSLKPTVLTARSSAVM